MQVIATKPKPMIPFMKKVCLECTTSCPKWCYDGLFPPEGGSPPPPLTFPDVKSQSSPTFSPLVIAIIGILASAFLLVSYYAIISKYCGKSQEARQRENQQQDNEEIIEEDLAQSARHDPSQHEPWIIITPGLDEALIKSITLVKYKKGDGLVASSDCSVCLGEFLEDDTLRLLPKCSHAFHVTCIDTWLRSHSNCPLCRANIISSFANNQPLGLPISNINPSLVVDNSISNNNIVGDNNNNGVHDNNTMVNQAQSENVSSIEEGRQVGFAQASENLPKINQFRALSDLGVRSYGGRDTIRRSISMDHRYEMQISIPNVVRYNHNEDDCAVKIFNFHDQSLKQGPGESSKVGVCNSGNINGVLHCVKSGVTMKRSFSSGRFLFSKHGRGNKAVIPL